MKMRPWTQLRTLARNLWWSWQAEVLELFETLDPEQWQTSRQEPLAMLAALGADAVDRKVAEKELEPSIRRALKDMDVYMARNETWSRRNAFRLEGGHVAYLSAEFGLHESLPIYAGGLGVLAGDHFKSASDLGVPLIGVSLLYKEGYFRQLIDANGWQQERYPLNVPAYLPLSAVRDSSGEPVLLEIETGADSIYARVWRLGVGRCTLLLLDAHVAENSPQRRTLTDRLYGGDNRTRIGQELLLGVGGMRALRAAGVEPAVVHLNEGHSAFASLELVSRYIEEEDVELEEALRLARRHTVFTTHTPVPAGHDRFDDDLLWEHLQPLAESVGLDRAGLVDLGRVRPGDASERFCMTTVALKLSCRANGVSALHGEVSRQMWSDLWPELDASETPIGHVTNGVHIPTWMAISWRELFDRYLGEGWEERSGFEETWRAVERIPAAELWETHLQLKRRLIEFVQRRALEQKRRRRDRNGPADHLAETLHDDVMLVGFARRFATYKRATLLLRDLDRLDALVNRPERPVRLLFAGKAHPHDEGGKRLLQHIAHVGQDPRFLGKVLLMEGYDMHVARHLVQGVDVWLNNPRRPLEASGTSGQKAAINGILNLSILDGWWAEGYAPGNGFAIGNGDTQGSPEAQDEADLADLQTKLEEQVVPAYFHRDEDGLPSKWIDMMRRSFMSLAWRFSARRMLMDYVRDRYLPVAQGDID